MTPVWIFPAYPLLLIGPFAGKLAMQLDGNRALDVIIGGFILQGTGFMVSLMIYAAFLYRLMTQKLPQESLRPGLFISVGPSGFTISGLISMGSALPRVVPTDFMGEGNGELAGRVSMFIANWAGLWLWGLAFWFFFVSVGAHWSVIKNGGATFSMTFYSYIFPNTALTTATFAIGKALSNKPINIVGCVMSGLLVLTWLIVFSMMIRAVFLKDILWPEKQEDREEGGWKGSDDSDDNEKSRDSSEAEVDREKPSANSTGVQTETLVRRANAGEANGDGVGASGALLQSSDVREERNRGVAGDGIFARRRTEDMV
nr:malic acid transport protein [Quercus suber]